MRRGIVAAMAVVAGVLASCIAVTGSTEGYNLAPAPGCRSSATCGEPTGDAGMLCCLTLAATVSGAIGEVPVCQQGGSCAPILLGLPAVQLCATDGECQGGVHCISQICKFTTDAGAGSDAGTQSFGVCGLLIPQCTVAPSGAGSVDAASDAVDAGGSE
jgi:hypothetical protein